MPRNFDRAVAEIPGREPMTAPELHLEHHFTPEQLAELWGLSADSILRLFEHENGVLVIEHARKGTRRYRTMRIPESVALRVHRRMRIRL